MHPLFEYLFKANGLLICFYLLYKFVLAKDTFFQFSRYYLLGGIVVSVVLPFITFTKIQYIEVKEVFIPKSASTETVSFIPVTSTEPVHSINWETIMLIAYGVIASILILKLLIGLGKLFSVIKQSERIEKQRRTYLQSHLVQSPFSFFNYIVYNPELINQDELEAILLHEEAHSNQNHSVDTLLVQFISIFFWFNPVVWLYQKSVVQNLEFLADEAAIAQVKDRIVYQKAMLKFNTKTASFVASNSFNQSLIKKRIVMLNTEQTNKKQVWKYVLILPVLVIFMLLFQVKTVAQEVKSKGKSKKTITKEAQHEKENRIVVKGGSWEDVDSILSSKTKEAQEKEFEKAQLELQKADIELEKANIELEKFDVQNKERLIIINGKEIDRNTIKGNIISKGKVTVYDSEEALKKFGEKGKDGAIIIEGDVRYISNQDEKRVVNQNAKKFTLSNGDECLIFGTKLKIPGHPTIDLNSNGNKIVYNKKNMTASEFLNFDHSKIKSISVLKLSSESVIDGEVKESKITGYYLTIQ